MDKWLYHIPHTTFEVDPEERTDWEDIWLTPEDDDYRDYIFHEEDEANSFWLTVEGHGMIVRRARFDTDEAYLNALKEYMDSFRGKSYLLDEDTGTLKIPFQDFNKQELLGWALVFLKYMGVKNVIDLQEVEFEDFPGVNEQTIMLEEIDKRLKSLEDEEVRESAVQIGSTEGGKKIMILPQVLESLEDFDITENDILEMLKDIDDEEEQ